MKSKGFKTAIYFVAGTMLASSCVGSFTMFNKLASWNKRATDSKFLNDLIFIVISPAQNFGLAITQWQRISARQRTLKATTA